MPAGLPSAAASRDVGIRTCEDGLRLALLHADVRARDELLADDYLVNTSLHKVLLQPLLLQLPETGRLRYLSFERRIEAYQPTP